MIEAWSVEYDLYPDVMKLNKDSRIDWYFSRETAIAAIEQFLEPYKQYPDDYFIFHMPDEEVYIIVIKVFKSTASWQISMVKHRFDKIEIQDMRE